MSQYSNIIQNKQQAFRGEQHQFFTVGPSNTGGPENGQLISYTTKSPDTTVFLDRFKISLAYNDPTENYLVFNRYYGQTLDFTYTVPIAEAISNPFYSNFTMEISVGFTLAVLFNALSASPLINESFSWRVRHLSNKVPRAGQS
jgi:hypothetical protein